MYNYVVVKCNFIIAVSKLEQSSCLIAWLYLGQKLYLDVGIFLENKFRRGNPSFSEIEGGRT